MLLVDEMRPKRLELIDEKTKELIPNVGLKLKQRSRAETCGVGEQTVTKNLAGPLVIH